jgi:hypothetical protein
MIQDFINFAIQPVSCLRLLERSGLHGINHVFHYRDGVYVGSAGSSTRFRWVKAPTSSELNQLSHTIAHRLARYLERQGLLERDAEHSTLALDHSDEDPMDQLRGHSITYRIAVGPQQGRKVFTLQTLPGFEEPFSGSAGQAAGFSLHAGVAVKANQREKVRAGTAREAVLGHKLERLCRYITRPDLSWLWRGARPGMTAYHILSGRYFHGSNTRLAGGNRLYS